MNKLDMIAEAKLILENEKLEEEKQRVLAELRLVENRVASAESNVICAEASLNNLRAALEKESKAAEQYMLSGDYAAYKKEVGIGDAIVTWGSYGVGVTGTWSTLKISN